GEQSCMRVVLDSVGVPLSIFESMQKLMQAMQDAIEGELLAKHLCHLCVGHSRVGIMHRDIRDGNVMIIHDPCKKHVGLMNNFDYSCLVDLQHYVDADGNRGSPLSNDDLNMVDKLKRELKERTGMPQFISVSLLQARGVNSNSEPIESEPIEHTVCHDLELFYWLLIWIVLCHTDHSSIHGALACSRLFDASIDGDAFELRTGHLGKMPLCMEGGEPLSWLMRRLKSLVTAAYPDELVGPVVLGDDGERHATLLMYKSVLQAFNQALVMDGWPENDKAIPFPPPTLCQTLNFGSSGEQKDSV
ncbi:hypothetical protein WOLCODRAFT_85161, partial [Wolfiporia cocos MD-104 SS10]